MLILNMRSIFLIPSQWRISGINAWNRISFTPAIFSVRLKYSDARSSPRFLALYTRYYVEELEILGRIVRGSDVANVGVWDWGSRVLGVREDWDMQECSHQEWRFDSIYEWLHVRKTSFHGRLTFVTSPRARPSFRK